MKEANRLKAILHDVNLKVTIKLDAIRRCG